MKSPASDKILLLKTHYVMSNVKIDHFSTRKLNTVAMYQTPLIQTNSNIRVPETDLLLERQRHICDCWDEEYDRMKSEVRLKLSK